MSDSSYILAFDLGGTKIAAAIFDLEHRRVGDIQAIPTMAQQPAKVTLTNLKRVGEQVRRKAQLEGPPLAVGMGSPGPLDTKNGRLLETDTLPSLMHFHMARFIEGEFSAPLFLENDANCFVLGEALAGAGSGHAVVVGVTLGTGFGCGIVMHGRIYSGATDNAGEVAYCPIAGGTFDEMLSGAGVGRFYQRVTGKQAPSAKELGEMAEAGDSDASAAWHCYGEAVGTALGTIAAVVDPSICVMGGSVAQRLPLFRKPLERRLRAQLAPQAAQRLRLEAAKLDAAAGVTGAAEYAFQRLAEQQQTQQS